MSLDDATKKLLTAAKRKVKVEQHTRTVDGRQEVVRQHERTIPDTHPLDPSPFQLPDERMVKTLQQANVNPMFVGVDDQGDQIMVWAAPEMKADDNGIVKTHYFKTMSAQRGQRFGSWGFSIVQYNPPDADFKNEGAAFKNTQELFRQGLVAAMANPETGQALLNHFNRR